MNKPIFGMLLGGVLGIFDGLSALVSAPETAPDIVGIVIGSTFKGLLAGVLIGWFSKKVDSLSAGVLFGLGVGLVLAFLVAYMGDVQAGQKYYWQIMLPGSILGIIVGYATQRYRSSPVRAPQL
jgi:membrane protease YdiL (CAAX protease family)